jgi:hypothetical protein
MCDHYCNPDSNVDHLDGTARAGHVDAVSPEHRAVRLQYRLRGKLRRLQVILATLAWLGIVVAWLTSELITTGVMVRKRMPSRPLGARSPAVLVSLLSRDGVVEFKYLNFRVVDRNWQGVPTTIEYSLSSSKLVNTGTQTPEDILTSMRRPYVSFGGFLFSHSTQEHMQSQDLSSPMFRSRYTVSQIRIPYYAPALVVAAWTFLVWRRTVMGAKQTVTLPNHEQAAKTGT